MEDDNTTRSYVPFCIIAIKNVFVHWQFQVRYFFTHPSWQIATY